MKVVILAGGLGTRISEFSHLIPKPMIKVGPKPILWHIMNHYSKFGFNDFIIALGYKSEIIKDYFLNYKNINSDFTVDLKTNNIEFQNVNSLDWKVTLVDTGLNTMTGGRVKKLAKYLKEPFMLTYGDGLSNINLDKLLGFHKKKNKMITVYAVHPIARFGDIKIEDGLVKKFEEKPQGKEGWINGGYFVINPEFIDLIKDSSTVLEKEPLEHVAKIGELSAFKHNGFWQCMDNKRDYDLLNNLQYKKPPWI